jgi:plasmid stabilization system protein ParE
MSDEQARYEGLLTRGAEDDLESIHDDIAETDCVANANRDLDRLLEVVEGLSRFPQRRSYPRELAGLGARGWNVASRGRLEVLRVKPAWISPRSATRDAA